MAEKNPAESYKNMMIARDNMAEAVRKQRRKCPRDCGRRFQKTS